MGFFSTITSYVRKECVCVCGFGWLGAYVCGSQLLSSLQMSSMLVPSELPKQRLQISEGVLLSLYEAVHLNRNFITVLTHVRTLDPNPVTSQF